MRISDWSSDVCSSDLWKPYGGHPYTPDEIAVPLISGAIELLGDPADQIIALRDHLADLYERLRPRHQGRMLHWHIRRAMLAEPCPCADRYPNPAWPLRRLALMLDQIGRAQGRERVGRYVLFSVGAR